MNIDGANTMSLRFYVTEHVRLNRAMKMSAAALVHLHERCSCDGPRVLTDLFAQFPYWGKPPVSDFGEDDLRSLSCEVGRMGIMKVLSSVDAYITGLDADLERHNAWKARQQSGADRLGKVEEFVKEDEPKAEAEAEGKPPRFETFLRRHQLNPDIEQCVRCVAIILNDIRNACAHSAGRASERLANLLVSEDTASALSGLSSRDEEWSASLPKPSAGDEIQIEPYHAILCADIYYRIIYAIDKSAVAVLGRDGLIVSAVHHAIKQVVPELRNRSFGSTVAAVNYTLSLMRVYNMSESSTIQQLRSVGLWEKVRDTQVRREY